MTVSHEEALHEILARYGETSGVTSALSTMDTIDTKSSALLTHVSIMIAVITAFVVEEKQEYFKVLLKLNLCAYIGVALMCLRNIYIFSPFKNADDKLVRKRIFEIADARRRSYKVSLLLTMAFTVFFLLSIGASFISNGKLG